MRFVLCGKNTVATSCLDMLVEGGHEVWVLATRGDDGTDGWQKSLRRRAEQLGVAVDTPEKINAPAFVEKLVAHGADALISIQYDQILRANLFDALPCPAVNLHFALLPRHRGVAPIAWAILSGDAQAGVTLHHMTVDIDAGDVIAQKSFPIGAEDTAREVYDHSTAAAIALCKEVYPFSRAQLSGRAPQNVATACYHRDGDFDFSVKHARFDQPAVELHRWLRAMIFPPMQYPEVTWRGRTLWITAVAGELGGASDSEPGVVVANAGGRLTVATADASLHICGMQDPAEPTLSPAEVMAPLVPGDQLGEVNAVR